MKLKKLLAVLLAVVFVFSIMPMGLALGINTEIYGEDDLRVVSGKQVETYALNSFSGNVMGEISDLMISEVTASFSHAGKDFNFKISKFNMDTKNGRNIAGANYYTGSVGSLVCNIIELNDAYCIQVFDRSKSIIGRQNDSTNNFTIVSGKGVAEQKSLLSNAIKTEIEKVEANMREENMRAESRASLRVYISTWNLPGIITGASAEGWCTTTYRGGDMYIVSSLSYVVMYNWPSDGVSLWYDYMNSVWAWGTPVWPSSAYTTVSGSWSVPSRGAFVAEATASIIVQGFPLMWTSYDVSSIY